MKNFLQIKPEELPGNPFDMIGNEWFLLTAGTPLKLNMMTASWGNMGILWHKAVANVFVRPQRFTFGFMEENEIFSLNFLRPEFRSVLDYCGSNSGRDVNKVKECRLSVLESPVGGILFEESSLTLVCRKIYASDIKPAEFVDAGIDKNYPKKDYHRVYCGEIVEVWKYQ